jgi:hypothetical protein
VRESHPPLAAQLGFVAGYYDDCLRHLGRELGRRHARKHLGWALDMAAASAGAPFDVLKSRRQRVLTADEPAKVQSELADAFDVFAWREAA